MKFRVIFFFAVFVCMTAFADSTHFVQQAADEDKHLFIFFYKEMNEKTVHLQKIFDETMEKMGGEIKFIKVKTMDPSEKSLVDKFDLSRSPMPFVISLAPNGAITGGFTSFGEQELKDSIASPGEASCIKALQDRKVVLLCLQNGQTKQNEAALQGVKDFKADSQFSKATEVIVMDPLSAKELKFIEQLGIEPGITRAVTLLISPPGEVVKIYCGQTSKEQIASDLKKASACGAGGCCPGGKCG